MPRTEFIMRSVVFVILRDGEHAAVFSATLRNANSDLSYEVELVCRGASHRVGDIVRVGARDMFHTYDECNAVCIDRGTRSLAPNHKDEYYTNQIELIIEYYHNKLRNVRGILDREREDSDTHWTTEEKNKNTQRMQQKTEQ